MPCKLRPSVTECYSECYSDSVEDKSSGTVIAEKTMSMLWVGNQSEAPVLQKRVLY